MGMQQMGSLGPSWFEAGVCEGGKAAALSCAGRVAKARR